MRFAFFIYTTPSFYFVTLSNLFIITNINSAESKHKEINTVQTIHKGNPAQRKPPTATNAFPIAVATNQPPIIKPLSFGGATFETNEIPIGESNNSANVRTK